MLAIASSTYKMNFSLNIFLVCINSVIIIVSTAEHQITFPINDTLYLNSVCNIKSPNSDSGARGICTKLIDCYVINENIRNSNYNHTVCGYEGFDQIVCCPCNDVTTSTETLGKMLSQTGITQINLDSDFGCTTKYDRQNGVLKFIEDCPVLQGNQNNNGAQEFCTDQLCNGLVCCPLLQSGRYNPICTKFDRPDEEIMFRLDVGISCMVKGLNVTGTYLSVCNAYDRNEISPDNAVTLCLNGYCRNVYCCPILKPNDSKFCKRRNKTEFPLIEFIGPQCMDSLTNLPGRCRDLNDCPSSRMGRQKFDLCGVDCCTNFYCCPEEDYSLQSISMQKCFGYKSTVYRKQFQIPVLKQTEPSNILCSSVYFPYAGGKPALAGKFPHMVALGYKSKSGSKLQWNCGGSIISEKYILTVAHCLEPQEFGSVKVVRMGSLYLENVTKPDECAEDFGVKRVIKHPSYDSSAVYNDIGLIELDREIKFNFYMRPVCLPSSPDIPFGLIGMGWGLLGPDQEKSETLYYGYLEAYTYGDCNKSYTFNLNRRVLHGIDETTQVCVGSRETIQSTCSGDSGGPLISLVQGFDRMDQVIGLTSFGTVCGFANSPGVYTKVYPYVKWIESIVWP